MIISENNILQLINIAIEYSVQLDISGEKKYRNLQILNLFEEIKDKHSYDIQIIK